MNVNEYEAKIKQKMNKYKIDLKYLHKVYETESNSQKPDVGRKKPIKMNLGPKNTKIL